MRQQRWPFPTAAALLFKLQLIQPPVYSKEALPVEDEIRAATILNTGSPSEPSWPHTGSGILLGVGISRLKGLSGESMNKGPASKESLLLDYSAIGSLFYPLDLGVSFGHLLGHSSPERSTRACGWIQWTLWEKFGWPALSARASHGRLFNLKGRNFQSWSGNLQLSWGYQRLSFWAGLSLSHHLAFPQESQNRTGERPQTGEKITTITRHHRFLGLHIQLIRNFLNLAFESHRSQTDHIITLKISTPL